MERVEYTADGNTLGVSIKYPDEIRRKWSECYAEVECEKCGSENISSDVSGTMLTVACHDCPNHWYGQRDSVLTWHDTEEALVSVFSIPFSEEPDF
jgi:hypothetical protein